MPDHAFPVAGPALGRPAGETVISPRLRLLGGDLPRHEVLTDVERFNAERALSYLKRG
ncbi:hypothetical protein AB0B45_31145 [Nonomuraea sp. NPDC049152]|uniref:hypothetical protein n=1 Tax=Nonomuraea sp. NPDC049152 TaxID=3154350 RepID=UPI0033D3CE83